MKKSIYFYLFWLLVIVIVLYCVIFPRMSTYFKAHKQTTILAVKVEHPGIYRLAYEYYSTPNCTGKPLFINELGNQMLYENSSNDEYYYINGHDIYGYIFQLKGKINPSSLKCFKYLNLTDRTSINVPINFMKTEKVYKRKSKNNTPIFIL